MPGSYFKSGHDRFLPYPFQFIIHPYFHSALHNLSYWESVVKLTINKLFNDAVSVWRWMTYGGKPNRFQLNLRRLYQKSAGEFNCGLPVQYNPCFVLSSCVTLWYVERRLAIRNISLHSIKYKYFSRWRKFIWSVRDRIMYYTIQCSIYIYIYI
jgi:hypothetical protein